MNTASLSKFSKLTPRKLLGWGILLLGAGYGLQQLALLMQQQDHVRYAFYAGMVAAMATALGALPALFSRRLSNRLHAAMLGFGGGVMLAASIFSLIVPALALFETSAQSWQGPLQVAAAILLGALLMLALERSVPHEHFIKGAEGHQALALKRSWLFVIAIILHNIPEGLAIGVAYASGDAVGASALTTGISLQNVPEGFVVAMALLAVGYSRLVALSVGMLSGLVEPIMAVIGAIVMTNPMLLPWGLAMAAGAMLFVISHEMIPESHRQGHEMAATNGLMLGFVLMLVLDTALG
ncbi:ZIP family metal transporter [Alkalimonas amylolytica]|uniref:Zinc transporter, ZIP family n=1 Tax=Alkalimonas amylolytica TaxID=152573 RepID=A0A1H4E9Y0_ALKAM|nr:ZIP family metal transporter [Alkalimonas amylolytica]SEA81841.1 zinc transporter, ZIP family [Alkalimonas amylolytica]